MKNNKGFTLIELIVVIAIIAVLSISVSAGLQKSAENTAQEEKVRKIEEVYKATRIYFKLKSTPENGEVEIQKLISKGLIDESIKDYDFCDDEGKTVKISSVQLTANNVFIISTASSTQRKYTTIIKDTFNWCTWSTS